jgi:hypothetical protein
MSKINHTFSLCTYTDSSKVIATFDTLLLEPIIGDDVVEVIAKAQEAIENHPTVKEDIKKAIEKGEPTPIDWAKRKREG